MTKHDRIIRALKRADLPDKVSRLLAFLARRGVPRERVHDVVLTTFTRVMNGTCDPLLHPKESFFRFLCAAALNTVAENPMDARGKSADLAGIKGGDA